MLSVRLLVPTAIERGILKTIIKKTKVTNLSAEAVLEQLVWLVLENLDSEDWDTFEVTQWVSDTADYYVGEVSSEDEKALAQFEASLLHVYQELLDNVRAFTQSTYAAIPPWDAIDYTVKVLQRGTHVEISSRSAGFGESR